MESISIEGTKYKKASSVAREFAYTNDYIGQLCRSGKVRAQLVGRSWFVDPTSIKEHKENRYRSTFEKTKAAVETAKVSAGSNPPKKSNLADQSTGYSRSNKRSQTIRYESDTESLLPGITHEKTSDTAAERSVGISTADSPLGTSKNQPDSNQKLHDSVRNTLSQSKAETKTVVATRTSDQVAEASSQRRVPAHVPVHQASRHSTKKPLTKSAQVRTKTDLDPGTEEVTVKATKAAPKVFTLRVFVLNCLLSLAVLALVATVVLESRVVASSDSSRETWSLDTEILYKLTN